MNKESCCCRIKLKVKDEKEKIKLTVSTEGGGHWAPYTGPYSVIPKIYQQILETKNKLMSDDVTVEEIPYTEVSNISGTTVIIATD